MLSLLWYNADAETNRKGSERMALPAWVVEKWEQLSSGFTDDDLMDALKGAEF